MDKENVKIVFVGHIDHGKSTLIGRLMYDTQSLEQQKYEDIKAEAEKKGKEMEFAHVMDHLKEERDQGITIDTAQTFFSTKKRNYVIIDAPGHKEFIKNMITGASQAEVAILIVDVNEGVMAQTKRHAYILNLIGINQVIVAMNKMDLVGYKEEEYKEVKGNLLEFLKEIDIKPKFLIPVSAKKGDNIAKKSDKMEWYKGPIILEALDKFEKKAPAKDMPLRFPVQDVYNFDEKTVVGRVESGGIEKREEVVVLPGQRKIKIKKIKKMDKELERAEVGGSIGLVLEGDLKRGNLIVSGEKPKKKEKLKGKMFWLSPEKIKKGDFVVFRCATQETGCEVEKIEKRIDCSTLEILKEDAKELKEHEIGEVILDLEKPVFVDNFNQIKETGRFVIEREETISAGGIITEV